MPLLQGALRYLCLLRADPPGSPQKTDPEKNPRKNIDGNPDVQENIEGKLDGNRNNMAVVVMKVVSNDATNTTTLESDVAEETTVGSAALPEYREPSHVGQVSFNRAAVLAWDSESLTSLLALHKSMAAVLLQSERALGDNLAEDGDRNRSGSRTKNCSLDRSEDQTKGCDPDQSGDKTKDYSPDRAGDQAKDCDLDQSGDLTKDGDRDRSEDQTEDSGDPEIRRRTLSAELFKGAEASLVAALAAAAAGAGSVTSSRANSAAERAKSSRPKSGRPTPLHSSMPSDQFVQPNPSRFMLSSGEYSWADSRLLAGACNPSRRSTAGGGGSGQPEANGHLLAGRKSSGSTTRGGRDGPPNDPSSEDMPSALGEGRGEGGEGAGGGGGVEVKGEERGGRGSGYSNMMFPVPQQKAVVISTAGRDLIVELYAMRCTAREGLGALEGALRDAQEAVVLAPRAPKLWAKAASLALRAGIHAGGGGVREGNGGQRRTEIRRLVEVRSSRQYD